MQYLVIALNITLYNILSITFKCKNGGINPSYRKHRHD